jgi:hypothetical protein
MCNGSLESYNLYLIPYKVSRKPKDYCICSSLPKSANGYFVLHWSLGVNWQITIESYNHLIYVQVSKDNGIWLIKNEVVLFQIFNKSFGKRILHCGPKVKFG